MVKCNCPYFETSNRNHIKCRRGQVKKNPFSLNVEKHKDKHCKNKYTSCPTYMELQKAF